jgi:hypothetical protein
MHRLTTSWLGLGVSVALACGAPAELEDNLFPGAYTGDDTGTSAGQLSGTGGTGSVAVAPPSNAAGTGSAPLPPVASGNTPPSSTPPSSAPPGVETPVPDNGATLPPAAVAGGACPDDITLLFNRPIEQGGCAGGACHVPGATAPDLVSPNPEARLVNVTSQCDQRPYIAADDSYLADKIAGSPPQCGLAMPFFMPQALSADDEACILAWIDEVSGG